MPKTEGGLCEFMIGEHRWQCKDVVLQERAQLAAEIEGMRTGPSPLEEAHAKHQEHVSDRDKFRSLLINLQVRTSATASVHPPGTHLITPGPASRHPITPGRFQTRKTCLRKTSLASAVLLHLTA